MENRTAMREERDGKPVKRESRLGFRSIFARRRGASEFDDNKTLRNASKTEIRDTLTADGNPSFGLQWTAMQSESQFTPIRLDGPITRPRTSTMRSPTFAPPKSPLGTSHKKRGSLATWDPVPLFQAIPQAIRTATLPACVQAESLLRVHNRRETIPDISEQKGMTRRKHRRNSSTVALEWTTKLYALVPGLLLQYSGEGTHDRLPEKVVQLCKDSAAFASDVIPGRHWVLQVSSAFDEGALSVQDTRSLFGKLALRERERRQALDILMVYESVEEMETWMTLLRKEIESLGGKRSLTETGAPKESADDLEPSVPPLPRTLAARDSYGSAPGPTSPDALATFDGTELHLEALTDLLPERSFDDNSTTASIISQDGRQLEGLRDSSNRFSFMSAARTVVTSDSSPCNSPMRNSFGSQFSDDATPLPEDKTVVEVRRRPNAAEIDDRRQSYRTSNIFLIESSTKPGQPTHRGHFSLSSIQEPPTPNFSLPHTAARRRTVTSGEHVHIAHAALARPPRKPRRPPPSSLGWSRPLSIVADSPSPSKSPLGTEDGVDPHQQLDTPSMCANWLDESQKSEFGLSRASKRSSMQRSLQVPMLNRPRKYASTNSLRPAGDTLWEGLPESDADLPASEVVVELPRGTTAVEPCKASTRSRSPIIRAVAAQRRESTCSVQSSTAAPRQRSVSAFAKGSTHRATRSDQHDLISKSRTESPLPPRARRRNTVGDNRAEAGASAKDILDNLCDLPQIPKALAQSSPKLPSVGPPPAPPPNKALPPLPPMNRRRSESITPRMRMRSASVVGGEI